MSPFLCRDRTCEFFVESHPCYCELPPAERPSWCPYNADEEIARSRPRPRRNTMPDYAVPPGDTLREVMGSLDMSQAELARRTELTVQTLNRILKGEQPITYETAGRLELVTGVPASLWNNLEAQYREQLARISERERLASKGEWLMGWPIWLMGWPIGWAGVEPLDRERFRSWKRSHGLY